MGFTEDDVNTSASRLYSDAFYLYYLKNMSKVGLSVYGVALTTSAHAEVREFLSQALQIFIWIYMVNFNKLNKKD
ncbi:spore coat protein CotF [Evansella vedderi]|uniref:Spore coat protein CotF n=1 Tax=Evansella vedderi TaxID=38282 RepID=A0ABU0A0D5_9BACI|nr:spore coat protein CotF [Evansella vedderi]